MAKIPDNTQEISLRDLILNQIEVSQGIKAVELALNVMADRGVFKFDNVEFTEIIERMVRNDDIVELEYTLPTMDYRVKSIYFPKGTVLCLNPNPTQD